VACSVRSPSRGEIGASPSERRCRFFLYGTSSSAGLGGGVALAAKEAAEARGGKGGRSQEEESGE
jgi:hypothetical protein